MRTSSEVPGGNLATHCLSLWRPLHPWPSQELPRPQKGTRTTRHSPGARGVPWVRAYRVSRPPSPRPRILSAFTKEQKPSITEADTHFGSEQAQVQG